MHEAGIRSRLQVDSEGDFFEANTLYSVFVVVCTLIEIKRTIHWGELCVLLHKVYLNLNGPGSIYWDGIVLIGKVSSVVFVSLGADVKAPPSSLSLITLVQRIVSENLPAAPWSLGPWFQLCSGFDHLLGKIMKSSIPFPFL